MACNQTWARSSGYHILNEHISDRSWWRLIVRGQVRVNLTSLDYIEMKRVSVPPPEPVVSTAFYDEIRDHHVAYVSTIEYHEGDASVRIRDNTIINRHISDTVPISIAEFQGAGRRTQPAICYCDVFTWQGGTMKVERVEYDCVIACVDRAV